MAKGKAYYHVLRLANDTSPVYVLATVRKFWLYSDAELYTQTIPVTRRPIIMMVG